VRDVFFVVRDGLKVLPDSVNAVFPQAIVQACVIHLILVSTLIQNFALSPHLDRATARGRPGRPFRSTPQRTDS